jgi:tRNA-dihydrouridine synthase B
MLFKNNCVIAAPMAGITDSIFRQLCRKNGADIVITEMVSVDGIAFGADATMELMRFEEAERPIGIQLFGSRPESFAKSARVIERRFSPDFIDLNAGCPVPKVTKKNGGSALLKDLQRFKEIVSMLVEAVSLPVTVKLRSGWHKHQWIDCEFARCAQECGAAAITLHPRSQTMMFSGHSFWKRIAAVRKAVSIPVIGNGDITSAADACEMKELTGCDGIMIGRAAYGNPWIFGQAKAVLAGKEFILPSRDEKRETALWHLEKYRKKRGEVRTAKEMKKHIAWYIKGMPGASSLRNRIFRAESTRELVAVVHECLR